MDFESVLNDIKKEYPLRRFTQTYAQIELDILFDGYNYIFIGVLDEDGKVYLTDFADYAPICNWEDEDIVEVTKICQKHQISFRNYHIECIYHSNDDVKRYLKCLLELKDRYVKE